MLHLLFATNGGGGVHQSCSPLWQRIDDLQVRSVAIVGVSKHAGKTTVLNRLLDDAATLGRSVAVISIGVDGERADTVLGIPKPSIRVARGTLLATALDALGPEHTRVRWLEPAGISSPLGEVWVGEAQADGEVILAGIRQLDHLLRVKALLRRHADVPVLIDGALARMVAIHPDVADGVILATGAVLGSLEMVQQGTRESLLRLTIPQWQPPDQVARVIAQKAGQDTMAGVITAQLEHMGTDSGPVAWDYARFTHVVAWPEAHAFAGDFRQLGTGDERLFVALGAVTDAVVAALTQRREPLLLVARDPSCVFVSTASWRAFARAGHMLRVLRSPALIAVTTNPVAIRGPGLDRTRLLELVQRLTDAPVWDVMDP